MEVTLSDDSPQSDSYSQQAENTSRMRKMLNEELVSLQRITSARPYSITHRLELATAYKTLGYPDLAAGDAYKALLLIDEVLEEGEYHEEALDAAKLDYVSEKLSKLDVGSNGESNDEDDGVKNWARCKLSNNTYDTLIRCLLDCGCFRSAFDYVDRAKKAFPNDVIFAEHAETLSGRVRSYFSVKGEKFNERDVDEYPDRGLVRRENYPWNEYEPNRFTRECIEFLNKEMETIGPKLEVKVTELPLLTSVANGRNPNSTLPLTKQLGVFAKESILPGEQILEEKSLLTAVLRLHDAYCDACSAKLSKSGSASTGEQDPVVPCEECDEVFFCSVNCHDLAQDSYHPALCGVSTDLGKVNARDAADALYSLLLVRALAMAQTQGIHPLELKEVRYIWGDYHSLDLDLVWQNNVENQLSGVFASVPLSLPFSFNNNVLLPLHMLEKMDVNIFTQSSRFDTWVFNTLYAKIRGTASAQQGGDGRPEIGAVHPMWCLANHSCDPNVAWEWQGSMRFWARQKPVEWKGMDPSRPPGVGKGDEILSHYCDIRLPVKERREWAVGALGGDCMCPRCISEAAAR